MRPMSLLMSVVLLLGFPTVCLADTMPVAIEEGTIVKLKLEEALSTKTASEGQKLQFTADEDILGKDGKSVVIKAGAPATGYLVNVDEKSTGKGGKLSIEVSSVKAVDDSKVSLRGRKAHTGDNGAGVGAYVIGYALFGLLGLGVVALCGKSKHSEVPAGTIITAFVDKDAMVAVVPTAIAVQVQAHETASSTTTTSAVATVKAETNNASLSQVVSQPQAEAKPSNSIVESSSKSEVH